MDIVKRLREREDLPSTFDFVGDKVEGLFDQENRHKRSAKPVDYLQSWLSMLRPFAFASKSDSWGELEKLLCIVMRNYIEMSREAGQAADTIEAVCEALQDCSAGLAYVRQHYGELSGVGFDRAIGKADAALAKAGVQ